MMGPPDTGEEEAPLLSMPIRVEDVPAGGVSGTLKADESQRMAIASALDLEQLDTLAFDYRLRREGKRRFVLEGRVDARYAQNCVITLEPLDGELSEPVTLRFWPPEDIERLETAAETAEADIDLDGPEPAEGGVIDVGQIAYEVLASGVDPYPRKPGAALDWEDPKAPDDEPESPFAALKSLRDDADGSERS